MRGRASVGQHGSIAAEQVAIVALAAAVIGAVWALAVPDRVGDAGQAAVDCLFGAQAAACALADANDLDGPDADRNDAPVVVPVGAAAQREADVHRELAQTAADLRDLAERDLADLAVWDELHELEDDLFSPSLTDEDRDEAFRRYDELQDLVAAAPDGSLLADLRDTEHLRRDPLTDPDDTERFLDVLDRVTRAEHADHLADLLQGWADSDRRFVHVEVDLDDGTVRVAEVVHGDLDASDHVAVVIPGTGNDGSNFDTATREDALALAETLELVPGGEAVSVVACLCYAPPPGLLQAGSGRYADAGGPDLARIIGELPVGDARLHALGHSYGATALGRAVTRHGLELEDTVSLGGPGFGSGVGSVDDVPEGAGRVWGIRHDLDPIDAAGMHGRNPDRDDFGAYGADVGDDDLEREWWKPYDAAAHSIYYKDAESLRNLALLVAGQHDEVSGYREGRP